MFPLRRAIARAAAPVGIIGAVGGFIGDIILPLGNFAPYVALISLLGAIASFIFLLIERADGTRSVGFGFGGVVRDVRGFDGGFRHLVCCSCCRS